MPAFGVGILVLTWPTDEKVAPPGLAAVSV
jgi:hypothetical protein